MRNNRSTHQTGPADAAALTPHVLYDAGKVLPASTTSHTSGRDTWTTTGENLSFETRLNAPHTKPNNSIIKTLTSGNALESGNYEALLMSNLGNWGSQTYHMHRAVSELLLRGTLLTGPGILMLYCPAGHSHGGFSTGPSAATHVQACLTPTCVKYVGNYCWNSSRAVSHPGYAIYCLYSK